MDYLEILLIIATGIFAGFVNAVAGGGSLLTLPVLIFIGLPSTVANATNRVAILFGAVSSTAGFRSKGVSAFPYSLWIGLSATLGAIIGAWIAVDIRGDLFNRILAVIMVLVVLQMVFTSKKKGNTGEELMTPGRQALGIIVFFFIGIYGGFIQAGVGFLIMAALTNINRFNLAKTNSAKVFAVLIYTMAAVAVFAYNGKINWIYGLILAVGNVTGAWLGSRWSVDKGEVWVKRILIVMVLGFAIKLWLY
jgi:uncharacterized protein